MGTIFSLRRMAAMHASPPRHNPQFPESGKAAGFEYQL
jgi:hypothetical protein